MQGGSRGSRGVWGGVQGVCRGSRGKTLKRNTKKPRKTLWNCMASLLRSNIQDFVQEVPVGQVAQGSACRGPPSNQFQDFPPTIFQQATQGSADTQLYYTILYYTIRYDTILYYTILYYTILYYTILYYTILYYTILYYTILYYTILYYTILY